MRPKPAPRVLDGEDVAVEIGDPLLALDGQLEVAERVSDVGLDVPPEEGRVLLDHVGGAGIAAALGHAGFQELVVERVQASQVERIGELADQVGGAHQPGLGAGLVMLAVLRHRIAGHLDRARDALLIHARHRLEAVAHEDLRAIDMIGRQRRIGRAALQRHRCAAFIDHEAVRLIPRAHAAHVAHVVHDQGQREMQPVGRLQRLPQQAPAQDGLADEGRQRGVIGAVVERIAVGDPLDHQPAGAFEDASVFRLPAAISPVIGVREMASQRFRYQAGRIEHPRLHRARASRPIIGPSGTRAVVPPRTESAFGGNRVRGALLQPRTA